MKLISAYQKLADYPSVKDTLECLDFGFKCQQAITESLSDGKVNLLDVSNVLKPLIITKLQKDGFQEYAKSEGKLGGQNKIPRLANDRKIAEVLEKFT